ncbi:MAG: phage portal protein [Armatimonadetes bacterium]|nr:phage portal protein [Armatimonadota bacterium]
MTVVSKRLGGGPESLQPPSQPVTDLNGAYPLPFDARGISRYYQEDPDIFISVNAIASTVCGRGYEIAGDEDHPLFPPSALLSRFEGWTPEGTFMDTLRQVVIDLNLLGNGYIEIARDPDDRPNALWWAPATDLRKLRDDRGYLQLSGSRTVEFNPYTPSAEARRQRRKSGTWRNGAHEILHLKLPNPNSRHYGLPPAYTVAKDVLADAACKDSNIAMFQNGLCPDYAVLVRGGTLSEETARMVREYLQEAHKGPNKHHGFLVLEAAGNAGGTAPEIELVPIQGRMTDMQWNKFRQLNTESKVRRSACR